VLLNHKFAPEATSYDLIISSLDIGHWEMIFYDFDAWPKSQTNS